MDQVTKSRRGGARPGAGRKSIAGKGTKRKSRQFSVTDAEMAFLACIGNDNRSAGFREVIDWADALLQIDPNDEATILESVERMRNVYRSGETRCRVPPPPSEVSGTA